MSDDFTISNVHRRWRFATCVFDERTLELTVGGNLVDAEPKPINVLRHLLHHAGEVVTKDELAEAIWPRRVLSDSVLAKTVSRLREVLRDDDQSIIRTVHGFGYRLAAEVEVEQTGGPVIRAEDLELHPGGRPPMRPLWTLEQRLGVGGQGEAWLARHDKTRECRVFKFARDEASLTALKREITLFRVINDTLGDDARVLRIIDWNLEQFPYFVESEFVPGGNLQQWADAKGGLTTIPLDDRLRVFVAIAEAVSAVHQVGVLHKDLKPTNLLMTGGDAQGTGVLLADFGSGSVLNDKELERLGITRMGFTETMALSKLGSGTPGYIAPEVVEGQPYTVKSDVYALGVILFQLIAGDFRRSLQPGWHAYVDDVLLRRDIESAAEGNVERRLGDAAELARRIRELTERRARLIEEAAAKQAAELAQRAAERARARRTGLVAAIAALVAGLVISSWLYVDARQARDTARSEAARAVLISHFLANDVFGQIDYRERPPQQLTVLELLDQAARKIDERLQDSPAESAELLATLAGAYYSLGETPTAATMYDKALWLYNQENGPGGRPQLALSGDVVSMLYSAGALRSRLPQMDRMIEDGSRRFGMFDPAVLELRLHVGRALALVGDYRSALQRMESLEADLRAKGGAAPSMQLTLDRLIGEVDYRLANYPAAENRLRSALVEVVDQFGPTHAKTTMTRTSLAQVQIARGQLDDAGELLDSATKLSAAWTESPLRDLRMTILATQSGLLLARGKSAEALAVLDEPMTQYLADQPEWVKVIAPELVVPLGRALLANGQIDRARTLLENTLIRSREPSVTAPPAEIAELRIVLAQVQLAAGDPAAAARTMSQPGPIELSLFDASHPLVQERDRVARQITLADPASKDLAAATAP